MFFIVLFLILASQTQLIIYVMRAFLEDLASCTEEAIAARLTLCGCLSEASSANVPGHGTTEDAMADPREASARAMCAALIIKKNAYPSPCLRYASCHYSALLILAALPVL